jgi:hypothetical protein
MVLSTINANISAVEWAMSFKQQVTLYLYNKDDGIYVRKSTTQT